MTVCNQQFFDFITENLNNQESSLGNNDYSKVSYHNLILRRVLIEDQDYPDFLLNLLEIQMMKELLTQHQTTIDKNDIDMFHEKFHLQILAYQFFTRDNKIQILDVLYLSHVNDKNFLILNSYLSCSPLKNTENKIKNEEKFNILSLRLVDMKQNYLESLDSFYAGLQIYKNKSDQKMSCILSSDDSFHEKKLRQIYIKPLYYMRTKLEEKKMITREYIWFLCCIGKRYHQLREVSLSLKVFEETLFLRSLEWGENTNETMDSLNRIGCALLRKKHSSNITKQS